MDIWIQEVGILPGLIFIIDLQGATMGHLTRIGPLDMKKFLYYLQVNINMLWNVPTNELNVSLSYFAPKNQEAIPIRMHGFHFINLVPFFDKVIGLMTPFIRKDLQDVLCVHSNVNDLYQYVPREMLPREIGGDLVESRDLRGKCNVWLNLKMGFL